MTNGRARLETIAMTEIATPRRKQKIAARLPYAIAIGALSLGLAACSTNDNGALQVEAVGAVSDDYRVNHPITIEEMLATLDVPVGLETRYLPRGMDDNIIGFAYAFMQSGSDVIAIVLPDGSANGYAAGAIAIQIEQVFLNAGVPLASIQYRSYPARQSETNAPIRLAYAHITANVERCSSWPDELSRNFRNEHYANYGCATQYNLAAMVANPLDLLYPRMMTPPNAARRDGVLGNYQTGEATGSDYDSGGGSIADGVQ